MARNIPPDLELLGSWSGDRNQPTSGGGAPKGVQTMNRHTDSKKFMGGKSLGTYRGRARHDPSTEAVKNSLHTERGRHVVEPHAKTPSVNSDCATLADVSARGATDFSGKS